MSLCLPSFQLPLFSTASFPADLLWRLFFHFIISFKSFVGERWGNFSLRRSFLSEKMLGLVLSFNHIMVELFFGSGLYSRNYWASFQTMNFGVFADKVLLLPCSLRRRCFAAHGTCCEWKLRGLMCTEPHARRKDLGYLEGQGWLVFKRCGGGQGSESTGEGVLWKEKFGTWREVEREGRLGWRKQPTEVTSQGFLPLLLGLLYIKLVVLKYHGRDLRK